VKGVSPSSSPAWPIAAAGCRHNHVLPSPIGLASPNLRDHLLIRIGTLPHPEARVRLGDRIADPIALHLGRQDCLDTWSRSMISADIPVDGPGFALSGAMAERAG